MQTHWMNVFNYNKMATNRHDPYKQGHILRKITAKGWVSLGDNLNENIRGIQCKAFWDWHIVYVTLKATLAWLCSCVEPSLAFAIRPTFTHQRVT